MALRRRNEAMLSSALKHGTTRHIEPHERQLQGESKLGVPPLDWSGNAADQIQSMIEVSVASTEHLVPELKDARYDFRSRTFRSGEGQPLTDEVLERWALSARRAGEASIGRNTLKRSILLRSLLRAESGEQPGLLERVLRQPAKLVDGGLRGAFYETPPEYEAERLSLNQFYSPLLRALEGAKQKQAPAKDWKAIIAKLPGVKRAEVEWLGVEEWLDAQDGQVARDDLAAFVRDGQIEVVESVGAERAEVNIRVGDEEAIDPDPDFIAAQADDLLDDVIEEIAEEEGIDAADVDRDEAMTRAMERATDQYWEQPESKVSVYDSIGDWEGEAFWNGHEWWVEGESFNDINDVKYWAEFEAQKARDRGNDFEARFDSYTEDGGDNYREILLRVPNLHETGKNRSANFGRFTISHPPKKLGIHLRV